MHDPVEKYASPLRGERTKQEMAVSPLSLRAMLNPALDAQAASKAEHVEALEPALGDYVAQLVRRELRSLSDELKTLVQRMDTVDQELQDIRGQRALQQRSKQGHTNFYEQHENRLTAIESELTRQYVDSCGAEACAATYGKVSDALLSEVPPPASTGFQQTLANHGMHQDLSCTDDLGSRLDALHAALGRNVKDFDSKPAQCLSTIASDFENELARIDINGRHIAIPPQGKVCHIDEIVNAPRSNDTSQYPPSLFVTSKQSGNLTNLYNLKESLSWRHAEQTSAESQVASIRACFPPTNTPFLLGQKVQRRDRGEEWALGYVVSLSPLKVTTLFHPSAPGVTWDEVRGAPVQNTTATRGCQRVVAVR